MRIRFLPSLVLLLGLGLAWGQDTDAPAEKEPGAKKEKSGVGGEKRRRGPQKLRIAEIQGVEGDALTLAGPGGETRTITLDDSVRLEENTDLKSDELKEGQWIFAMGKADEEGSLHARRIQVLPEGVEPPKPRKRPETEPNDRPRPILGPIASLDPLTVKGVDDETVRIVLEQGIKIQRPQPIAKEALTPGTHVMVRFKRGEDGAPKLAALVKISAEDAERIKKRAQAAKRHGQKKKATQ